MNRKILKRIKRRDRIARYVITVGGMAIIFSVILILFLIARVTFPLFQGASTETVTQFALPSTTQPANLVAAGLDDYQEHPFVFGRDGVVRFYTPGTGSETKNIRIEPLVSGANVLSVERFAGLSFEVLWDDGSQTLEQVRFTSSFDEQGQRIQDQQIVRQASFPSPSGGVIKKALCRFSDDGRQTQVALLNDGGLLVRQHLQSEDLFGNLETASHEFALSGQPDEAISALALDRVGNTLYAGTDQGTLLRWDLSEPGEAELLDRLPAFPDRRAITALTLIFGDVSLAVGDAKGGVSTWFAVRVSEDGDQKHLQRIHTLASHNAAIKTLYPSLRDKSLVSVDADGVLHLDHMTSERHLLSIETDMPLLLSSLSPDGRGLFAIDAAGKAHLWTIHNPHPEVSWKALFGKVWYEGYDAPAYMWQSSASTDDFEPKMSLTPLVFGTIKGTFYAMLFAVPLAILGAIYTSQFGNSRLRGVIKPAVEVMAAIPSVIIGFLAALWFAPLVERSIPSLFLSLAFVPLFLLFAMILWQFICKHPLCKKLDRGYEFLLLAPVLVAAVFCAIKLGPVVEAAFFGGNVKLWLFNEAGVRYDGRNNIIIAFALGFAVIPIIFTMAEDALSNVPGSLKAASLALGASRWQTVWRVILPSGSPGIFAGTMIGFGRAIGETMIVLMATGNTAIMDWSIFNGMRPLSANIAVEIPEAPVDGSLYRVLFLSAVILFIMTFVLNTVAELVRQHLRKKYGRF
jgi:phosphate transport system permease protein